MSELTDMLGLPPSARAEAVKKALELKSNDRILVKNPTDEDYPHKWDGVIHVIPSKGRDLGDGKGQRVLPRYLAEGYIKHMTDKILFRQQDEAVKAENKRRVENGMAIMNKWQEEPEFARRAVRPNDPETRRQVALTLYGGLVQKFGQDALSAPSLQQDTAPEFVDTRNLLLDLDKELGVSTPPTPVTAEVESSSDEAISGIAE